MTAHRKLLTGAALAVLGVIFVAAVLISNSLLRGARLDLTQNHLYTLAPGTRHILSSIDEPIQLYLYFSGKASQDQPQLKTYAQRVREMLDEMVARAGGKLKLKVIDPLPFSEDEDRATTYGLQAVPLGQNGSNVFLGLVGTNSTNGQAAIPFLQPDKEAFLEYDVAKLIHELSVTKKPVVGLISGLPLAGGFDPMTRSMSEPWEVDGQLKQLFDVRELDAASLKTIDPDITTLVLVHPKKLSDDAQYAIDQFVMRGGHLLVFVDPFAEADSSGGEPGNPQAAMFADKSSDLPKLFAAWGVVYDPTKVVLDRAHAAQIRIGGGPLVRDPAVLSFTKADLSRGDVITANLDSINVATPGFFSLAKHAKAKLTPLIETSADAKVVSSDSVRLLPDPQRLLVGYQPSNERYVIAGRLEGALPSAFPDRKDPGHLSQAKEAAEIVLVADTDILSNRMWVQMQSFFGQRLASAFANNGDLFVNAVDNLTGSSDLISIRGRGTSQRPFTRIDDMKRAAEDRFRDKEAQLQNELKDTEGKLLALQTGKAKGTETILSPEQQEELSSFLQKRAHIRTQLRQVRRGLDEQIDALGTRVKLVDIGLMPLLVTIGALAFAGWRRRRRAVVKERP
jgi:ABC-type uncharacterized transport system involved in gliding motility auxiliary subunit